jgi:hypothetical protein
LLWRPGSLAWSRSLQNDAPREVQGLAIEPDGSFEVRTGLFWAARRPN